MKKILLGLLLLSSALSFGATQRVSLEKLETNESKDILYLAGTKTPYSGEAEIRYSSGQLLSVATFKNGKINGKAYEYYPSGQLKLEENYINGKLNGLSKSYYENGQLQDEIPYKNDKKEGIVKTYIENGTLISEVTFKNGVVVGKSKLYNTKTGKLAAVSNINNRKIEGVSREY